MPMKPGGYNSACGGVLRYDMRGQPGSGLRGAVVCLWDHDPEVGGSSLRARKNQPAFVDPTVGYTTLPFLPIPVTGLYSHTHIEVTEFSVDH